MPVTIVHIRNRLCEANCHIGVPLPEIERFVDRIASTQLEMELGEHSAMHPFIASVVNELRTCNLAFKTILFMIELQRDLESVDSAIDLTLQLDHQTDQQVKPSIRANFAYWHCEKTNTHFRTDVSATMKVVSETMQSSFSGIQCQIGPDTFVASVVDGMVNLSSVELTLVD